MVRMVKQTLQNPCRWKLISLITILLFFLVFMGIIFILTSRLTNNDFYISVILTLIFSPLIILLYFLILDFYEWKYEKKSDLISKKLSAILAVLGTLIIAFSISSTTIWIVTQIDNDKFFDNVKGAIFLYKNETNVSQGITLIIINSICLAPGETEFISE